MQGNVQRMENEMAGPNRRLFAIVVSALLLLANEALAIPQPMLSYNLGTPSLSGNILSSEVSVTFAAGDDNPSAELMFLEFDVSGSSSSLTDGGASFAGFHFVPGLALADWDVLSDFGSSSLAAFALDTVSFPLSALVDGTVVIGTLSVSVTSAAAGSSVTVAISGGPLSEGGVESPAGNTASFSLLSLDLDGVVTGSSVQVQLPVSQIPEPTTFAMATIAMGLLSSRRFGKRSM